MNVYHNTDLFLLSILLCFTKCDSMEDLSLYGIEQTKKTIKYLAKKVGEQDVCLPTLFVSLNADFDSIHKWVLRNARLTTCHYRMVQRNNKIMNIDIVTVNWSNNFFFIYILRLDTLKHNIANPVPALA